MSPDPWTAFLDWLTTVLVPAWNELIALLPYFLILGVIGPIITIIGVLWVWYLLNRRRGRIRRVEVLPTRLPVDPAGLPILPVNAPYCEEHGLLYPPRATRCDVDGADLQVICPVDGTARDAEVQVCSACGTRYVLGTTSSPIAIAPAGGPPEGGAAVA